MQLSICQISQWILIIGVNNTIINVVVNTLKPYNPAIRHSCHFTLVPNFLKKQDYSEGIAALGAWLAK